MGGIVRAHDADVLDISGSLLELLLLLLLLLPYYYYQAIKWRRPIDCVLICAILGDEKIAED